MNAIRSWFAVAVAGILGIALYAVLFVPVCIMMFLDSHDRAHNLDDDMGRE